jgi:hypothetical protein
LSISKCAGQADRPRKGLCGMVVKPISDLRTGKINAEHELWPAFMSLLCRETPLNSVRCTMIKSTLRHFFLAYSLLVPALSSVAWSKTRAHDSASTPRQQAAAFIRPTRLLAMTATPPPLEHVKMPMLLPEDLHGARHNIQPIDFLSRLPPRGVLWMCRPTSRHYSSHPSSPPSDVSIDGDYG